MIICIEDVAFSSHTDGGKLKYTIPSPMDLHGLPYEFFNSYQFITYQVSLVQYNSMTQQMTTQECGLPISNCQITFGRQYTPVLYYLTPPVVWSGLQVGFMIDPRYSYLGQS